MSKNRVYRTTFILIKFCLYFFFLVCFWIFRIIRQVVTLGLELCDGGSVSDVIRRGRQPLTSDEIAVTMAAAARGLHYLHAERQVLHRDIKRGNILFNADNEPKLVDFGLVTKAEAGVDYSQQIWGTPYYIAPEKLRREPETFLADMYSAPVPPGVMTASVWMP